MNRLHSFYIVLMIFHFPCFSMETTESQLLSLVKEKNWRLFNTYLVLLPDQHRYDLNLIDCKGLTLLHHAILDTQIESVKHLITKGANVNTESILNKERINTPLHCASYTGNTTIISLLLSNGASIDSTHQYYGSTPLHLAVWFGNVDATKVLIKNNANIEIKNLHGSTPVHLAAWREQPECLQLLINQNAKLEEKNRAENLPLYLAAQMGSYKCLRLLLQHSPNKNKIINLECGDEKRTALRIAICCQKTQCVWDLVRNGSLLNTTAHPDITKLTKTNVPLENFIRSVIWNRQQPQQYINAFVSNCQLCNSDYQENDVILEPSCSSHLRSHSFHSHCFEQYALQKRAENAEFLHLNENKSERAFILNERGFNWDYIKQCPSCQNQFNINLATLSVKYKK